MTIEIHCPFHRSTEVVELPDGYYNFEGEIKCLWDSGDEWYKANQGIPFFMMNLGASFSPTLGEPLTD